MIKYPDRVILIADGMVDCILTYFLELDVIVIGIIQEEERAS